MALLKETETPESANTAAAGRPSKKPLDEATLAARRRELSRLTGFDFDAARPEVPKMIEAMMPSRVPTAPMVLQARRNSAARVELIDEFGLLSSGDIAELNQSKAENRAALASRWKGESRIFSVKHDGRDWFPGFQFDPNGRPRKEIVAVLSALGNSREWETALWFTASNAYLDGDRPVDRLADDPEAVLRAAEHEAADIYF